MTNLNLKQLVFPHKPAKLLLVSLVHHSFFYFSLFTLSFFTLFVFSSCNKDEEFDPYDNWQARNDEWFAATANTARAAIVAAKRDYPTDWENHTEWRMFKSLMKSPTYQSGMVTDSICVRILKHGTGTKSPISTDTVYVAFQGYLMPTTDAQGNRIESLFASTYQGQFNPGTATFNYAAVSGYKDGFYTALQYMVAGDSWEVFIPYQLFYGETAQNSIPAYSTVRFLIHMKE